MCDFMQKCREAINADIEAYSAIPQPPQEFEFIGDLKKPLEYHFKPGRGVDDG